MSLGGPVRSQVQGATEHAAHGGVLKLGGQNGLSLEVSAAGAARQVGAADGQHGMQLEELMSVRNFRLAALPVLDAIRLLGIVPGIEAAARQAFGLPAGTARNGIARSESSHDTVGRCDRRILTRHEG